MISKCLCCSKIQFKLNYIPPYPHSTIPHSCLQSRKQPHLKWQQIKLETQSKFQVLRRVRHMDHGLEMVLICLIGRCQGPFNTSVWVKAWEPQYTDAWNKPWKETMLYIMPNSLYVFTCCRYGCIRADSPLLFSGSRPWLLTPSSDLGKWCRGQGAFWFSMYFPIRDSLFSFSRFLFPSQSSGPRLLPAKHLAAHFIFSLLHLFIFLSPS